MPPGSSRPTNRATENRAEVPTNPSPYPPELTVRRLGDDEQHQSRWVGDNGPSVDPIVIVDPDPGWSEEYERRRTHCGRARSHPAWPAGGWAAQT